MNIETIYRFFNSLLIVFALATPELVLAATDAGFVKALKGDASILREGINVAVVVGAVLKSEDILITGASSSVSVTLKDGTMLSVGPNSRLLLTKFKFDEIKQTGELDASVKKGTLAVISGKLAKTSRQNVVYRTPNAILGVRGTTFVIEVGEEESAQ